MGWRNLGRMNLCSFSCIFVLCIIIKGISCIHDNHILRIKAMQELERRSILDNLRLRTRLLYDGLLLELLKQRLDTATDAGQQVVTPATIDLISDFNQRQNVHTNKVYQQLETVTQPTTFTGNIGFVGTASQLISKLPPPSKTEIQNSVPSSNTQQGENVITKANSGNSQNTFAGFVTRDKSGGFVFQTPGGVRVPLPKKSAGLVIKSSNGGIELKYLTPTPIFEEEEIENEKTNGR